ncbi:MAG: hypothetical protein AAB459_02225 [Patescibacteria group bacterium]
MKFKSQSTQIHTNILRASRIHFIFGIILAGQIMLYDATKLQTPDVILQRWILTAVFIIVVTTSWYLIRTNKLGVTGLRYAAFSLIIADIFIACFSVYTQRGMASRAVFLFIIPLLTAATLQTRAAIFGSLALCITAYSTTAITYFVTHFNEGYKVELYGEVGFYSLLMTLVAMFIWNLSRSKMHR